MSKEPTSKDVEKKSNDEQIAQKAKENDPAPKTNATSPEEKAAKRAGVGEARLGSDTQNREPKTKFEKENQKVTDKKRQEAQKVSNMDVNKKVEQADEPKEAGKKDAADTAAVNAGSEIAKAIAEGLSGAKEDKRIKFTSEKGVQSRFSLVKNKEGEVMLRENSSKRLSKLQLKSLEEKESSLQDEEVEEL